jgi:hypothetical protein
MATPGIETDTDFQEDITVPLGTDLAYIFSVQPLDVTGCTAQMITSFGTFTTVLSVMVEGDQSVSQFSTTIPNASLPSIPGVYTWKIMLTWPFAPPVTLRYGHGSVYVTAN